MHEGQHVTDSGSVEGGRAFIKAVAYVAVVIALLVVIGSVALILDDEPTTVDFEESYLEVTAREWFDQTAMTSLRVGTTDQVLVGSPGPAPQFDTGDLGTEQMISPLRDDSILEWATIQSEVSDSGTFIVAGVVAGVVDEAGGETVVSLLDSVLEPIGAVVCTVEVSPFGYSRGCDSDKEQMRFGASGLRSGTGTQPDVMTIRVPNGTSVVAIEYSGRVEWQRPIGNLAAFVGEFDNAQVRVTLYEKDGTVILETVGNPLS